MTPATPAKYRVNKTTYAFQTLANAQARLLRTQDTARFIEASTDDGVTWVEIGRFNTWDEWVPKP